MKTLKDYTDEQLARMKSHEVADLLQAEQNENQKQIDQLRLEGLKASKRHMAFPSGDAGDNPLPGVASEVNLETAEKLFAKRTPHKYTFEEVAIGRMLMAHRDGVLPDDLEGIFQSGAGRKYTMTEAGVGTGKELVPTPTYPALWRDVVLQSKVMGLFAPVVPMTSQKEKLSKLGDVTFYKPAGEGQAVTATDLATAERELTAYALKGQVDVSDELADDAVIALIPQIRSILVQNAGLAIDKVLLVGDTEAGATGNVNSDDAAPGGTEDYLMGINGLVKYALVTNSGQSASLTTLAIEDFAALLALLDGKYCADPSRLAWIADPWTALKTMVLEDFRSVDKLGDRATILTGMLGSLYAAPFIVSEALVKVDDDGKYTTTDPPTNDTDGRLILVHRSMWKVGMRKTVKVATERSEAKGLTSLVVTMRVGFIPFTTDGKHTAIGYDIDV